MSDAKVGLAAAKARLGGLAKAVPSLMQSFAAISKVATTPGQFSAAQKELVAVAIAVAKGCEDCILYHLDAARRHGADEAALIEALEVAVEMGGGPAVMYSSKALEAWRNLA
jgi:AhpD family alkylhydroperoxidase